ARPVTGATAAKVTAAALARYPGQVEGVVALRTGDYVAHVFRSSGGEVHVLVNSRFEVTGLAPPPPGAPGGGAPPQPRSPSSWPAQRVLLHVPVIVESRSAQG